MTALRATILLVVVLVVGACSGPSEDEPLTISSPDATAPVETRPTTTTSSTTSTTLPETTTTLGSPGTDLDLFGGDIDVEGLDIGFASVSQEALVTQRLDPVQDALRAWTIRTITADSGEEVIAVIAAPVASGIGIPGLSGVSARQIHSSVDTTRIEGVTITRAFSNDRWWHYWHSNSRLFVVVGDEEPAAEAIAAMITGHDDPVWEVGDCLLFDPPVLAAMPNAPFGTDNIVDCDQPHTVEVSGAAILGDGPDAPFPGDEMGGKSRAFCDRSFDEFIGGSSRRSDLGQISYLPSEEEWQEGDRYLACIVFTQDAAGAPAITDRSYAGAGAEFAIIPEIGDCYSGGSQVSCTAVHDTDYLGPITFPLESYPSYPEAVEASNEACRQFADDTIVTRDVPDARVFAFTMPFSAYEFEQGSQLDCYASVLDTSGSRLAYRGAILDGTWIAVGPDEGGLEA
ncbi:MAG: hypothetical protein HKN93_01985 [Acidimicrobiia bacterium]|nr:hypothetical protein [Acidimicrobiia bacterium]